MLIKHSISLPPSVRNIVMAEMTSDVVAEIRGFFQILSDGSVKRFPIPSVPASPDFTDGFKSKDVVIDASKPITARIFVPEGHHRPQLLLPVVVYFHGGGFCVGSATSWGLHHFLAGLCVKSQALIVSVDYRLAPEHKIPAAYDDCYRSVVWLSSSGGAVEAWLEGADLSRVFLSGESAGANIAHHVALRLAREWMVLSDATWRVSLPEGADRDHWACNFEKAAVAAGGGWPAVIVFVAGKDVVMERGVMYAEFLKRRLRVEEVEVVVAEGEEHAFHCFNPHSQPSQLLITQMAHFINHH